MPKLNVFQKIGAGLNNSSGDTGPLPEDDEADDEGDGLRW